jgi:ribonuclease HII
MKPEKEALLKARLKELLQYENALYEQGLNFIAGVDEVGRGPLAGPVCAAAVVLPQSFDLLGVDDSKKLTEKKRNELYDLILGVAPAYGTAMVENTRIDEVNILNATKEAMLAAIKQADRMLREKFFLEADSTHCISHLLVDALELPDAGIPCTAIIKGDSKSASIAAASIIAKVTRDRLMLGYEEIYPGYGFASNKGYGTKAHYEGLEHLGMTPIHRRSFLKNILSE